MITNHAFDIFPDAGRPSAAAAATNIRINEADYDLADGRKGKLAVLFYVGDQDPREVLDDAVDKYTAGSDGNHKVFVDAHHNCPWARVVVSNISDMPQVSFREFLREMKIRDIIQNKDQTKGRDTHIQFLLLRVDAVVAGENHRLSVVGANPTPAAKALGGPWSLVQDLNNGQVLCGIALNRPHFGSRASDPAPPSKGPFFYGGKPRRFLTDKNRINHPPVSQGGDPRK